MRDAAARVRQAPKLHIPPDRVGPTPCSRRTLPLHRRRAAPASPNGLPSIRRNVAGKAFCIAGRGPCSAGEPDRWHRRDLTATLGTLYVPTRRGCFALISGDADLALTALLVTARDTAAAANGTAELDVGILRQAKAEAALLIALADIGGVWPVARRSPRRSPTSPRWRSARPSVTCSAKPKRAASSSPIRKSPAAGSGYVVLAMGKNGRPRAELFQRYRSQWRSSIRPSRCSRPTSRLHHSTCA